MDELVNYPTPGGIYRHYKGGLYKFLFMSRHTETDEVLCNYKSLLYGSYASRPLTEWNKPVTKDKQMLVGGMPANSNVRFNLIAKPKTIDGAEYL